MELLVVLKTERLTRGWDDDDKEGHDVGNILRHSPRDGMSLHWEAEEFVPQAGEQGVGEDLCENVCEVGFAGDELEDDDTAGGLFAQPDHSDTEMPIP